MVRSTGFLMAAALVAGMGIGFIVGGGAGFLVDRGDEISSEEGSLPAVNGEGEGSVEAPVGRPEEGGSPAPGGEETPGASAGDVSKLTDIIASVPIPETRTGNGKISGRVRREDGRPLAGVRVRATPVPPRRKRPGAQPPGGAPPEDRDLEAEVLRMIAGNRRREAGIGEAATGDKGTYALSGLADSEYELEAVLDGYEIERKGRYTEEGVKPGETVDFVARAVIEVKIDVFLPGGRPPPEARIRISAQRQPNRTESWRPGDSTLRFTPGTYKLHALAGTRDEFGSKKKTVTLDASAPAALLAFHLEGRCGIRGRVQLPEGFAIDTLYVHALRQSPESPSDPDRLIEEGLSDWVSRNQGYRYSFMDLAPGTYLVGTRWTRSKIAASGVVEVGDGLSSLDLVLPPPAPGEYVVLRVFGPKGEVLRDVQVKTGFKSRGYSSTGGGTVALRQDGSFLIIHQELGGGRMVDTGSMRFHVTVESSEYGVKKVEYSPREASEIKVAFEEPARLEVQVAGYAGSGLEGKIGLCLEPRGKEMEKRRWSFERYNEIQEEVDSEGRRSFGPLEPGPYEVALHIRKGRYRSLPVNRLDVTLRPGENRASMNIPTLYSLTVTVEKPKPGAHVYLGPWKEDRGSWSVGEKVGEDGRAVFKHLPEGDYRIYMWGNGRSGEMKVKVPARSLVRFEPKARTALRVRIVDPEGYLAQAGLRTNDLVIAVEGEEFKSSWHIEALLFGALSKEQVILTVIRGGAKLEVPADPKKLMEDEGWGGDLTPTSR